jgi:hypothetical protein
MLNKLRIEEKVEKMLWRGVTLQAIETFSSSQESRKPTGYKGLDS